MDTFLQTAFQSLADHWCFPFSCSSLSALVQKMVVKCLHLDLTFCITQDIFACLPDLRTFYRKHGNKHQDLHLGVDSGPPKAHIQPYLQESSFTTKTKNIPWWPRFVPFSYPVPLSLCLSVFLKGGGRVTSARSTVPILPQTLLEMLY